MMDTYKKDIEAGKSIQIAVGNPLKDASVHGVYSIIRGTKVQSGHIQIDRTSDSLGNESVGDVGVTITGNVTREVMAIKFVADSSDSTALKLVMQLTKTPLR